MPPKRESSRNKAWLIYIRFYFRKDSIYSTCEHNLSVSLVLSDSVQILVVTVIQNEDEYTGVI